MSAKKTLTPEEKKAAIVEKLSSELHAIYQKEAHRQAGTGDDEVRHPEDYNALAEHIKEYDRVLARFILQREAQVRKEILDAAMQFFLVAWDDGLRR